MLYQNQNIVREKIPPQFKIVFLVLNENFEIELIALILQITLTGNIWFPSPGINPLVSFLHLGQGLQRNQMWYSIF